MKDTTDLVSAGCIKHEKAKQNKNKNKIKQQQRKHVNNVIQNISISI